MTRFPLFNSPFLLGFDEFERTLDRVTKTASDGYPPYNIEQLKEDGLRITVAVAGFDVNELGVSIEDNELVIQGEHKEEEEEENRVFHHRGIATRRFERRFVLTDALRCRVRMARQAVERQAAEEEAIPLVLAEALSRRVGQDR